MKGAAPASERGTSLLPLAGEGARPPFLTPLGCVHAVAPGVERVRADWIHLFRRVAQALVQAALDTRSRSKIVAPAKHNSSAGLGRLNR